MTAVTPNVSLRGAQAFSAARRPFQMTSLECSESFSAPINAARTRPILRPYARPAAPLSLSWFIR